VLIFLNKIVLIFTFISKKRLKEKHANKEVLFLATLPVPVCANVVQIKIIPMKKLMLLTLLLLTLTAQGQTARTFKLELTEGAHAVAFLPENPTGKAIVGIPGGGYSMLSNTHEGTMWAEWLNKRGIAYFVVNYRLPNGDRTRPIGDVESTFRIVRDSAQAWGIHPRDIGIMGFSAGGHLASVISTLSRRSSRLYRLHP